jgi:two-component system, OmpR family, KDP operon response regulator KdpE
MLGDTEAGLAKERGRTLILAADDDPAIRTIVSRTLELNDFMVVSCANGTEALTAFAEEEPDLVILDVKMPEIDGLTVCREIRAESRIPIIMLTGMEDEGDAAAALELGADDYIRKPFGTNELLARVRAILRRTAHENVPESGLLVAGEVAVDVTQHTVHWNGEEVNLTRTEFNLLVYLLSNQNRVLTHDQILEKVWGADYIGSHHVLRVCISRMRQKFGDANALAIEALSGVGYRLRRTA